MKKYFKKLTIFAFIAMLAATALGVKAQSAMTITNKSYIYTGSRKEAKFQTNKGYAYCITPHKTGPAQGTTLSYQSKETTGGVLYLLSSAGTSDSDYLATQLAIWQYDSNYLPDFYKQNSNATVERSKTLAKEAAKYSSMNGLDIRVDITASNGGKLSKTSDGSYKSGPLTVTTANAGSASLKLTDAPSGTKIVNGSNTTVSSVKGGTVVYVVVPASSAKSAANMKITASATGTAKWVERYTTGSSQWQDLVVLVTEPKTVTCTRPLTLTPESTPKPTPTPTPTPTPKSYYCQKVGNDYYGIKGKKVTYAEYDKECNKHVCEKVGDDYYGSNGKVVTYSEYDKQCNKHICEKVGDDYFGKKGTIVTESQYDKECNEHICKKVGDEYYGIDGDKVSYEQYDKECNKHVCEKVGDDYFGKKGTIVKFEQYDKECNKHVCEKVDDTYFGKDGSEVTEEEYADQCFHICEIIDGKYYGQDGKETTEDDYKNQCEAQIVDVPDTGAGDNLLFIILGSIFLGTVCGVVSHKRSLRTSK